MKAALLLVLLLAPQALVLAETFDLTVSIENPRVIVNYTKPVRLEATSIFRTDPDSSVEYELVQVEPSGGQAYSTYYVLVTREQGSTVILTPGNYQMTLSASDTQGVTSTDIVNIHVPGLDIFMLEPPFGVAKQHPFDVLLLSRLDGQDAPARCSYATTPGGEMTPIGTGFNEQHPISGLDYRGRLYVECEEQSGRETAEAFDISWDNTPPSIAASISPRVVINPADKSAILTIQTDEPTACTVDERAFGGDRNAPGTYATLHENRTYYSAITDTNEHNLTHAVRCVNLAGLSAQASVNVTVNFGLAQNIEVLSPPPLISTNDFSLVVKPSKPAQTCDADGVAMQESFGTFSLGYNDVAEGLHALTITCEGVEVATRTYNVTVDTQPPTLTLNASQLLCQGNVSATWHGEDNDQVLGYHYEVRDNAGVIAEGQTVREGATARLTRPLSGTLTWRVTARDRAGNNKTAVMNIPALRTGEDEECGLPPFIRLVAPGLGFAPSAPYTVRLETSRVAECRYSLQSGADWSSRAAFPSTDGVNHDKSFSFTDQVLHVWCKEPDGRNHTKPFRVGVDTSAPIVAVDAVPNPVIDPSQKIVVMTVTTSDPTFCTYNGQAFDGRSDDPSTFSSEHVATLDFRSVTSTTPEDRSYEIRCVNLAGLNATKNYVIHIDLGTALQIARVSPADYTAEPFITLAVRPNMQSSCEWKAPNGTFAPFESSQDNVHSVGLGNLPDGSHQYIVQCTASAEQGSAAIGFTIDRVAPDIVDLSGPASICANGTGRYAFNISGLDQRPLIQYGLSGANSTAKNTTDHVVVLSSVGVSAGRYTLSLTAIGRNNLSSQESLPVEILAASCAVSNDTNATDDPLVCSNGVRDTDEGGVDCGGICSSACIACALDTECPLTMTCTAGQCVKLPGGWSPPPSGDENESVDDPPLGSEPAASCTSDYQCNVDQVCEGGRCVRGGSSPPIGERPDDIIAPPSSGGMDWLALTFIILGVVLMGGSGWYLYQQHTPDAFKPMTPQQRTAQAPPSPRGTSPAPPDASALMSQEQARRQAMEREQLLERIHEQKAKRAAERHSAFDAFGKPGGAKPGAKPATQKQPPVKDTPKNDAKKRKKDDEVFDALEKL